MFLSTTEPTHADGSTRNPTRSLCDPYVFNTALTRAKSLVVAVGNPFLLLSIEKQMVKRYGQKGHCWSTFLKRCMDHGTLEFVNEEQRGEYTERLQQFIQEVHPKPQESDEMVALRKKLEELEANNKELQANLHQNQVSSVGASPSHFESLPSSALFSTPNSQLSQSQNLSGSFFPPFIPHQGNL